MTRIEGEIMRSFPLLEYFLLKDAEGDIPAEECCFKKISADEWEAIRKEYKIPSGNGIICIIACFDTENHAGK